MIKPDMPTARLTPLIPYYPTYTRSFNRRSLLPPTSGSLWRIDQGIVRTLTWLEDGTVITLGIWKAGDIVGQTLSRVNPFQMECLTAVEAIALPPESLSHMTEAVLGHIQCLEELTVIRHHKRIEDALIQLLLWLAKRFGRTVKQGHLLDFHLTHQDLAELLGTTRVTVTRILSHLEEQGLINRLSRQQMVISDMEVWHYEI
jgi:CRP-like cAMP-binding protein